MYTDSSFKVNSKQSCFVWLSEIENYKLLHTANTSTLASITSLKQSTPLSMYYWNTLQSTKPCAQQCGKLQVEVLLKLFEHDSEDLAYGEYKVKNRYYYTPTLYYKFLTFMTLSSCLRRRLLLSLKYVFSDRSKPKTFFKSKKELLKNLFSRCKNVIITLSKEKTKHNRAQKHSTREYFIIIFSLKTKLCILKCSTGCPDCLQRC